MQSLTIQDIGFANNKKEYRYGYAIMDTKRTNQPELKLGDYYFELTQDVSYCTNGPKLTLSVLDTNGTIKEVWYVMDRFLMAVADVFSIEEFSQIEVTKSQLLSNDSPTSGYTLTNLQTSNVVNLVLTWDTTGTILTITSTNTKDEVASYDYRVQDSSGRWSDWVTCYMSINERIPVSYALVFTSFEEANSYMNWYTPPTMEEVFYTWNRSGENVLLIASEQPKDSNGNPIYTSSPMQRWAMSADGKQFYSTENYHASIGGLISLGVFTSYIHEVSIGVYANPGDDDMISVVLAHVHDGSDNHYLLATLTPVGRSGGIAVNLGNSFNIYYVKNGFTGSGTVVSTAYELLATTTAVNFTGNYTTTNGRTRVKVVRDGNIFTVSCSGANVISDNYLSSTEMTIDISQYANTQRFQTACSYGYAFQSLQYTSYWDVEFESTQQVDLNKVYDASTGDIYEWDSTSQLWSITNDKMWDVFISPSVLVSALTGAEYYIQSGSIGEWGGPLPSNLTDADDAADLVIVQTQMAEIISEFGSSQPQIAKPVIVVPVDNSTDVTQPIVFESNPIILVNSSGGGIEARWQVSSTPDFNNIELDSGMISYTTKWATSTVLSLSTTYYCRLMYTAILPEIGYSQLSSQWSDTVTFTTDRA